MRYRWITMMLVISTLMWLLGVGAYSVEIHPSGECDWTELFTLDDGHTYRMFPLDNLLLVSFFVGTDKSGNDRSDDVCIVDLTTDEMSWVMDLPLRWLRFGTRMENLCIAGSSNPRGTPTLWEFDGEYWQARPPIPFLGDDTVHKFVSDGEGQLWAQVGACNLEVLVGDEWHVVSGFLDAFYWYCDFPFFVPPDEVWIAPLPLEDPFDAPVGIEVWSTHDFGLKEHITSATGGKATDFPIDVFTDRRGITWLYGCGAGQLWLSLRYEGMWFDLHMSWAPAISRTTEDEFGNMWFGTRHGLLKLNADDLNWHFFPHPDGLPISQFLPYVEELVTYNGRVYVLFNNALWSLQE